MRERNIEKPMIYSLKGRSALITGANQGFGLAVAHAYVKAGANIMLCARDAAKLEQARKQLAAIAGPGQQVLAHPADVSKSADVEKVVSATIAAF